MNHGVPVFLDQLRDALRLGQVTNPEIGRSAIQHGHDLLRQGFSVSQVVHDYGDVCQAITELAVELDAPISIGDFRTLNRCLDDAIAGAVTEYGRERNQSGIDGESARGSERLGFFAHELRNLMNTAIQADRQVLAAVVGNLLQNAFKFTRPRTTVTLRVGASPERVLIEVHDECGGLPSGDVNALFRPFEQGSADRTGVGLGLAFSRWGAEANDGRIYARNLPGKGCVFTVDLPRLPVPALEIVQS
jgi:signal transduction histidine kinase